MRARLALIFALFGAPAWADIPAPCTGCEHTPEQAGYPPCISTCAKCGRTCKYAVGYVGGGCLGCCGEVRRLDEGTFGWDYDGGWRCGRVFLNWCHCGKSPKPGPYKVDGPNVPDIGAIHPIKDAVAEKKKSPCHEAE
jgi:hypothetical protein